MLDYFSISSIPHPPSYAFESKANIKYVALLGTLALLSSWCESVMTLRTSVTFIGSKILASYLYLFPAGLDGFYQIED